MQQIFLEGRGPFEQDPYFQEAREELMKMAHELDLMPDTPLEYPDVGYLMTAVAHWQANKGNVHTAVRATEVDDNLLETVFSFLPDHLLIIINGSNIALNSTPKLNISIENDGFTLIADQIEYQKNTSGGKIVAGRCKITRKYQILLSYNWNMMQAALSNDGKISITVPVLPQSKFSHNCTKL